MNTSFLARKIAQKTLTISFLEIHEIANLHSQSPSDFFHIRQCDVLFCSFNHTDVGAVNVSEFTQSLLRYSLLRSLLANALTKLLKYFFVHTYTTKCRKLLTMVLHTIVSTNG